MAFATILLTGCKSLYGKYERPEVNTSGLFRDAMADRDTLAVRDTSSFANIPWRKVFTDPQLQGLIEKGLAHNPNLLNAALSVQMAEAQLKAAKLSFLPSFAFTLALFETLGTGGNAAKQGLSGVGSDQVDCQHRQYVLHIADA